MSQVDKASVLKKLGNNIRNLRSKQNMSQEELAFRVESARNFIGCIERAEKSSSIITLCRIAKAFQVPVEELVKGIDT